MIIILIYNFKYELGKFMVNYECINEMKKNDTLI